MVDASLGYIVISFCDIFFGYNEILMWEKYYPKTTFIIDEGVFCYKMMPFGLKNVWVTDTRVNGILKILKVYTVVIK